MTGKAVLGGIYDVIINLWISQNLNELSFFIRISLYLKNYYNSVFDVFNYIYLVKHKLI